MSTTFPDNSGIAAIFGTATFGGFDGGIKVTGPTPYVRHPLQYSKCGADFASAAASAVALAAAIRANYQQYANNETLVAAEFAYASGQLLARQFICVVSTVVALPDLLILAGAAGIVISSLYYVSACLDN